MSRKINRSHPVIIEDVLITATAAEGKALARIDDKVLFVPFAAPGDIADIEIYRSKSNYMEGRIIKLKTKSDLRVEPFCSHFGLCGGCKWQHLLYEEQLNQKRQQVKDQLERIGGVEIPEGLPIVGSQKIDHYRNKLEYTFSPYRWLVSEEMESSQAFSSAQRAGLGFHLPGKFDKVLDITKCHLQPEPSNEIRLFIKQTALDLDLPFYDVRKNEGLLRNIIIRCNEKNEFMLIVILKTIDLLLVKPLFDAVLERFSQIVSLQYCFNDKFNDSISDLEINLYKGVSFLTASMPSYSIADKALTFRVGPKSFYQTNAAQAENLYKIAGDFANIQEGELVYDLYTGTGTIALYLSEKASKIVGVEYVEEAVCDARLNAKDNNINNVVFFAGDMAKVLTDQLFESQGRPDVVITDPPRDGMAEGVVEQLLKISPSRIVYISCNAATQARDIKRMDGMYKVEKWQAVDMFPHTFHVENVVLLIKRLS